MNRDLGVGSRHQSRPATGARAKISEAQVAVLLMQPLRGLAEPVRQQTNVKSQVSGEAIFLFLGFGQQVKEARADPALTQKAGHELIARTMPAAAAAVRE